MSSYKIAGLSPRPDSPSAPGPGERFHPILAVDLGGVFELYPSARSFIRFDVGDEMVRSYGPGLRTNGVELSDTFMTHHFRFTIGVGTRF